MHYSVRQDGYTVEGTLTLPQAESLFTQVPSGKVELVDDRTGLTVRFARR